MNDRYRTRQENIYLELTKLNADMIRILFNNLGYKFDADEEEKVKNYYGSETVRMMRIDIMAKELTKNYHTIKEINENES